jgi:hypothetical protein
MKFIFFVVLILFSTLKAFMNTHAEVKRLDHLGIIAGVIKDLKLVAHHNYVKKYPSQIFAGFFSFSIGSS